MPNLSTHLTVVPRGPLYLAALALVSLAACGPIVKVPRFGQRPDSVKPGSMLGPFEGRVLDADSGQPLEGALVWCSWGFSRGMGAVAPYAARSASVRTNADGRYHINKLRELPSGLSVRLSRLSLVVYQPGYVAYRQDRVFQPRLRRHGFSQRKNVVRLARWSPELSHAQHLLFLGGDSLVQSLAQREVRRAVAELGTDKSDPRTPARQRGSPESPEETSDGGSARRLLTSDEVRSITGFLGALNTAVLADAGDAHDSLHLRAVDRPERYDVAIRLWRLQGDRLTRRYEALLDALPGSKQTDEIGERSFVVTQGAIRGLAFIEPTHAALVLLTCGSGQCTTADQLRQMAQRAYQNLSRLPQVAEEEASTAEDGGLDGTEERPAGVR